MRGRRAESYEDFFADDDEPRFWITEDRGNGKQLVHIRPPCGHHGVLSEAHSPEINEDGSLTVRPNPPWDPGNSNSILCACGWHGYVYSNDWREVG